MKKISILGLSSLFLLATLFTSCESLKNANNTQKGAGIGVGAGAIIGGLIDLEQETPRLVLLLELP